MMTSLFLQTLPLLDRVMPGASEATAGAGAGGDISGLNLMLIVGLALAITFLARYFSARKRKK